MNLTKGYENNKHISLTHISTMITRSQNVYKIFSLGVAKTIFFFNYYLFSSFVNLQYLK